MTTRHYSEIDPLETARNLAAVRLISATITPDCLCEICTERRQWVINLTPAID